MLDDLETKRLKKQLNEATHSGSIIRIAFEYVDFEPQYTLRLQVINDKSYHAEKAINL